MRQNYTERGDRDMIPVPYDTDLIMMTLSDLNQDEEVYSLIESNYKKKKICYLLLRTAFSYLHDELKRRNILSNMHIIDFLGKKDSQNETNISSLNSPGIPDILKSLNYKVKNNNCNLIIVDTISQLLHYHSRNEIQVLTNRLKTDETYRDIKKIFLFSENDELVQDESTELFCDLSLFADKIITNKEA